MGPGQQPWDVLSALPAWQLTEVPVSRSQATPKQAGDD